MKSLISNVRKNDLAGRIDVYACLRMDMCSDLITGEPVLRMLYEGENQGKGAGTLLRSTLASEAVPGLAGAYSQMWKILS